MTITELLAQTQAQRLEAERARSDAEAAIKRLLTRVEAEGRERTSPAEEAEIERLAKAKREAGDQIKALDGQLAGIREVELEEAEAAHLAGDVHPTRASRRRAVPDDDQAPFIDLVTGKRAAVTRGQRFGDHEVVSQYAAARDRAEQAVIGQHGSLGMMLRAMTTTSGSAVVPVVWSGDIIDRARNLSAVLQAGAEIVPMAAKTVNIGRLTGDPTAAFRAEGSTITASDPVFDQVQLDSKTMSALVIGSLEWFQDSPNIDDVVSNAIAQAVATNLDLQALFGGITTGGEVGATGFNTTYPTPPNPRGVLPTLLAVAASSVLGSGANGTAQTALSYWNEVIDTIFTPRQFNEAPNALLWSAKGAQQYAKAYDSTGQPLQLPPAVAELQRFVTNQIPSFTQGTMTTRATDLFVGDWRQLLIGQRLDFTVQTLVERYAENGQIGIVAHWRGDVQLARPRAFAVYRYLQGA
jgi:HK97 family phage major capsid protein